MEKPKKRYERNPIYSYYYAIEIDRYLAHKDQQLSDLRKQVEVLRKGLQGMMNIVSESRGVDGFHLNGDTAYWNEFEEEIDQANKALQQTEPEGK